MADSALHSGEPLERGRSLHGWVRSVPGGCDRLALRAVLPLHDAQV